MKALWEIALSCFVALLLVRCSTSSSPVAGGGSDMPNGAVAAVSGTIMQPDSTPAAGVAVLLRSSMLTARGDSIIAEYRDTTDRTGRYRLFDMVSGSYTLYGKRARSDEAAIRDSVVFDGDGPDTLAPLMLSSRVTITGHLYVPDYTRHESWSVFIPGTSIHGLLDTNGTYVVPRAPAGTYSLAFGYDKTVNVTRIAVHPGAVDTVYLRDIEFAVLDVMADVVYGGKVAELLHAYYVSPTSYNQDMAPPWYRYIDFSYVTHYSGRADGTIVPWNDDTAGTRRLYDFVAAGYVYRDSVDRVILAAYGDRQYVLRGAAVEEVDSVERYATVAIERRIDVATGATEYWAIEVRYAAPRSSGS